MAIEGNDWWILGGAAAGGAVLGALLRNPTCPPPRTIGEYPVAFREYDWHDDNWRADVLANFDRGGYIVLFEGILSGPHFELPETFGNPEEAAIAADKAAKKHRMKPSGPWKIQEFYEPLTKREKPDYSRR